MNIIGSEIKRLGWLGIIGVFVILSLLDDIISIIFGIFGHFSLMFGLLILIFVLVNKEEENAK